MNSLEEAYQFANELVDLIPVSINHAYDSSPGHWSR